MKQQNVWGALALAGVLGLSQASPACEMCKMGQSGASAKRPAAQSMKAAKTSFKTATFAVSGMHCGECAKGLTQGLMAQKGVRSASVNLGQKRAVVRYNPALVSQAQLRGMMKKLGFPSTPVTQRRA